MSTTIRLALATLAAMLTLTLAGCTAPERGERRAAYLDDLVAEFDAESVADVVCTYATGEAGALTQLSTVHVFAGTDSLTPAYERLQELGYRASMSSSGIAAGRTGAAVSARALPKDTEPDVERRLEQRGCDVPPDGVVLLMITEHTPSDYEAPE